MNKTQIIALLEDGAFFATTENKLFHGSFRKGFRALKTSNISWQAVQREHGPFGSNRLYTLNNEVRIQA